MVQHLRDSGLDVSRAVGVIIEFPDGDGGWEPKYARVCQVLTKLPEEVRSTEQGKRFDPELDLCLTWPDYSDSVKFILFSLEDNDELFEISAGGIIILSAEKRIIISQGKKFMESVHVVWAELEGAGFTS